MECPYHYKSWVETVRFLIIRRLQVIINCSNLHMTITQSSTRLIAVAAGSVLALGLLFGVIAGPAKAAGLTQDQIKQIVGLLQAFGADQATLNNVTAALNGQATPGTPTGGTTGGSCTAMFVTNLQVGSSNAEVKMLQQFLNKDSSTMVAATGAGSPGAETMYFGPATKAAVVKFQAKYGISPTSGYVGPLTRAKLNSMCGTTTTNPNVPGTPVTGNGLKVMLASDSPVNVSLVQGQAAGELAKFTFANPTSASVVVTNLAFKRIGVSNDSTMTNVYIYNGAVRLTDSAGVSNSAFNYSNPVGLFTVPAGSTYTVSVRSDIAGSTSGQQIGVQLVSVGASGALDSSVSFPINGGLQSVSAATLATVDFNTSTLPSVSTVDPQADYTVWQNNITVGTRAVTMKSFALRNIGSIQTGDVRNFRLYVDGVQVGSAVATVDANSIVTFDLSASPVRIETGGRVVKVLADVVGGASRTFSLSLRYPSDAIMVDTDLNQPVLPTAAGTTFSPRTATSATINSISTSAPSITRASDSPTQNVSVGASNVKWASFKFLANGEDVKVESLNVNVNTSVHNGGLDNGKVFLNGVQIGSTKDLVEATDVNFTFGSSMILKAGTVATVDIYADAKTSTSTNLSNTETVAVSLTAGSQNGQGQISLSSVNVPTGTVSGNTITVASASLTATKASGYGNQTIIAGSQNAKIGSFVLSGGSTEGVNVNTIEIGFGSAVSSLISDLVLKDPTNGNAVIGTAKSTVGTTNAFSVSINIPASGTKTIDVYANVKTDASAGAIPATTVTTNTTGTASITGNSVSVGTAATLQTITIGSAVLTAAVNTGSTPDAANVVAGATSVKVGSFRFTTQYSGYTVDKVAVKIPANAATSVSSVMLKYKDINGAEQTATQAVALSTGAGQTHATSTFTGLTFYIPENTDRDLDVYVSIPTIASGASTGAAISVLLDAGEGFNATDSSGTADTSLSASDLNSAATSGKGTLYVRKSIATLSAVALDSTTLQAGSDQVLGRVKVSADNSGDIGWKKISFTVNKTAAITLGATSTIKLWDITSGSAVSVAGVFGTTTGAIPGGDSLSGATSGNLTFVADSEQQVTAGSSRTYELRGTVGGIASGANSVSVSIANPSTSITTGTATGVAADTVASTPSFGWTDRSSISTVHSESTSDWTDDYLVKTLPITLGTRSVNF